MTFLDWGVISLLSAFSLGATLRGLGASCGTRQRRDDDEDGN